MVVMEDVLARFFMYSFIAIDIYLCEEIYIILLISNDLEKGHNKSV